MLQQTTLYREDTDKTLAGEPIEVGLNWQVTPGHEETFSRVIVSIIDITGRKHIEREREGLIADLEMKNAELERFAYTISHDLKSPLVTINGYLGYLEQDAASGNLERHKQDARRIRDAVNKMHRLLSDLLELSRIGRTTNATETIHFEDLIHEALEIVHGQLEQRGVTVRILSPQGPQPNLPAVYGDRQRLTEVLQNPLAFPREVGVDLGALVRSGGCPCAHMMKAVIFDRFGDAGVLHYAGVPRPSPGPGQVRARLHAAALNLDLFIRSGERERDIPLPHIPGCDGAGIVDEAGEGVTLFHPGDRVAISPGISCGTCSSCAANRETFCRSYHVLGTRENGTYAEYVCVPEANLVRLSEKLSCLEGAAVPLVFLTAWHMLVTRASTR